MGLVFRLIRYLFLTFAIAGFALAAPMLRLATATVGPVSVATGSSDSETVEAFNAGDGSLSLKLDVTGAAWLSATVGSPRTCLSVPQPTCVPLQFALNTSALDAGVYTGVVTVSDPNAVDAPQTITVTVQVGGGVPSRVETYAAPGYPRDITFYTNTDITMKAKADNGGSWLALPGDGAGTFKFRYNATAHPPEAGLAINGSGTFEYVITNQIKLRPPASLAPGTYTGTVTTTSAFAPDNKIIAVIMHLVSQPIAQAGIDSLQVRLAQGAPYYSGYIPVANLGPGTLQIAKATTDAAWITSATSTTGGVSLVIDPGSLAPGTYNTTVSISSNAANGAIAVPVQLTVVPKGNPLIAYQGVMDNGTYTPGAVVAPGEIMIVKGEQLAFTAYEAGPAPPLATQVAGAQVLVNGRLAPMYYSIYSQLAFELPMETEIGTALVQVQRDGLLSNKASIHVGPRGPRILLCPVDAHYGIITFPEYVGNLAVWAIPAGAFPGVPSRAAHRGDTVTIWAIGLGATSPGVATGAAAPGAEPLARLIETPQVSFGGVLATPSYAGLTPTLAGLYQVNVTIPSNTSPGMVDVKLIFSDSISNTVSIPVQ